MRFENASAPIILGGLMLLSGCTENAPLTEPTGPRDQRAQQAGRVLSQRDRYPQERPFEEISSVAPGFGGYFLDGDQVVAYVTDLKEADAVRTALPPLLRDHLASAQSGQSPITVRQAQYSFIQLRDWRNRASAVVFSLPDVVWLDLDERRNRVVIGFETGVGSAEVERALTGLGVPPGALAFEVTGRLVLEGTLREHRRPLAGGLLTWRVPFPVDPIDGCTLGFNVAINGSSFITTASHCGEIYAVDQHLWHQPNTDSIGREGIDPQGFFCDNRLCRYSDVSAISFSGPQDVAFGFIYRTMNFSYGVPPGGGPNPGSIDINESSPRFRIIGQQEYSVQGQLVLKIGQKTGWTSGHVNGTCVEFLLDLRMRLCQDRARYYSENGDSGSPVFLWPYDDDRIILLGSHVGRNLESGDRFYSPLGGMGRDFGSVITYVSVSINGPSVITEGGTYAWEAFPSPANLAYSYQWSVHYFSTGTTETLGTAPSQSLDVWDFGHFEMQVTVTSSSGATASRVHFVNNNIGCPGCPEGPRMGTTRRQP